MEEDDVNSEGGREPVDAEVVGTSATAEFRKESKASNEKAEDDIVCSEEDSRKNQDENTQDTQKSDREADEAVYTHNVNGRTHSL